MFLSLIHTPEELAWTPHSPWLSYKKLWWASECIHAWTGTCAFTCMVLEHPSNLHVGLLNSTPLHHYHQPGNSLLRYVFSRAVFTGTTAMLLRNRQWLAFLWATQLMTVIHGGLQFRRVHVDLRRGFFLLAVRLARDERLWVDATLLKRTFRFSGWCQSVL